MKRIGLTLLAFFLFGLLNLLNAQTLSPQGKYIFTSDEFGSFITDTRTLQKRFIVSEGSLMGGFFSEDDQYYYYPEENEGFYRLNLQNGKPEQLTDIKDINEVYPNLENGAIYFVCYIGTWEAISEARVYRLVPGQPIKLLATLMPEDQPAIGALDLYKHKEAGKLLARVYSTKPPETHMDSPVYGASNFISIDIDTGAIEQISSFPSSTNIEYHTVRPTEEGSNIFEFTNTKGVYHLLDVYTGEILRIIDVPGVDFNLSEKGLVVAKRREKKEGKERYFIDFVTSGNLKTLQNFEVSSRKEMNTTRIQGGYQPTAKTQWFSQGNVLLHINKETSEQIGKYPMDYTRINLLGSASSDPDQLLLAVKKDYSSGEKIISYNTVEKSERVEAASPTTFAFSDIAFHPTKPEFVATDADYNVHFFRIARSGIQHTLRGKTAAEVAYSLDGESILSRVDYEDVLYRYKPDAFPADKGKSRVRFPTSPPPVTLPNYGHDFIQSESQEWLLQMDSYNAYLHQYDNPSEAYKIDTHGYPRESKGIIETDPTSYLFSKDESQLFQLKTEFLLDYDTDTYSQKSTLSGFGLTDIKEDFPEPKWSIELDSRYRVFAGIQQDTSDIRVYNLETGEVEFYDVTDGTLKTKQATGLSFPLEVLARSERRLPFQTHYAETKQLLTLFDDVSLHCLDWSQGEVEHFTIATQKRTESVHAPASMDLLVIKDHQGGLHFHSLAANSDHKEIATLTCFNSGKDYLLQANNGQFDATRTIQETGFYRQGMTLLPLSQIFDKAYEPNLLSSVLAGIELPDQALAFEQIERAPTTEIRHSTIPSESMTLKLSANSPKGNLAELNLYQNQKLIKSFDVLGRPSAYNEYRVSLLPGLNSLSLVAVNVDGIQSAPSVSEIQFGSENDISEDDPEGRRLHLLVVGINEYQNQKYSLNYALPDARSIADKLNGANASLYDTVQTYSIYDREATAGNIIAEFEKVRAAANPQDTFIFYFAGHGVMSKEDNLFYLVPTDVTQIYGQSDTLKEKGLSSHRLKQFAEGIATQKQVFILDACNSGGALEVFSTRGASQEKALAQLARSTGTHWLTASSSAQFATEFAELGHGAFTYTLLQGLSGAADSGDERVSINELKAYLESELPRITKEHKGTPQYPTSYGYGRDFPVAINP